jgi:hypothetical protein
MICCYAVTAHLDGRTAGIGYSSQKRPGFAARYAMEQSTLGSRDSSLVCQGGEIKLKSTTAAVCEAAWD